MSNRSASLKKIVNPNLAIAALNNVQPYGEFKAYVKLAKPKTYPSCLKSMELYAPGLFEARIPCDQFERVIADNNVISIELREHIASSQNC